MVEARKKTDQFEAGISTSDPQEMGTASEGVIAYCVQTRDPTGNREGFPDQTKKPLYLMTLTALQPGESMELDGGVNLRVVQPVPNGFIIRLTRPPEPVTVPSVIGADSVTARGTIQHAGLVPNFVGPLQNSEVARQSPEGGALVPPGSMVTLHMTRTDL